MTRTKEELEAAAKRLYESNTRVAPKWDQLGDTTKSVWRERAAQDSSTVMRT